MAASLQVGEFCNPLAAVTVLCCLLSPQFPALLSLGAIQPPESSWREKGQAAPGENFRTSQKVLIKVWREVPIPSFHFCTADVFFSHSANFSLDVPSFLNLILFPTLGLPVFSVLPSSWSQSLNHLGPSIFFPFLFCQSFNHSFCLLNHYLFS